MRVKKWGNSAAVRIPSSRMHAASLDLGKVVDVREEAGRIVIEPVRRKSCELGELLKGITSKNQHETVDFGPVVGKEVLADRQISVTLHSIHENFQKPWTVATLASTAGMSRSAFAARFKEIVGGSPAGIFDAMADAQGEPAAQRGRPQSRGSGIACGVRFRRRIQQSV
jgi:antitoxin MazE